MNALGDRIAIGEMNQIGGKGSQLGEDGRNGIGNLYQILNSSGRLYIIDFDYTINNWPGINGSFAKDVATIWSIGGTVSAVTKNTVKIEPPAWKAILIQIAIAIACAIVAAVASALLAPLMAAVGTIISKTLGIAASAALDVAGDVAVEKASETVTDVVTGIGEDELGNLVQSATEDFGISTLQRVTSIEDPFSSKTSLNIGGFMNVDDYLDSLKEVKQVVKKSLFQSVKDALVNEIKKIPGQIIDRGWGYVKQMAVDAATQNVTRIEENILNLGWKGDAESSLANKASLPGGILTAPKNGETSIYTSHQMNSISISYKADNSDLTVNKNNNYPLARTTAIINLDTFISNESNNKYDVLNIFDQLISTESMGEYITDEPIITNDNSSLVNELILSTFAPKDNIFFNVEMIQDNINSNVNTNYIPVYNSQNTINIGDTTIAPIKNYSIQLIKSTLRKSLKYKGTWNQSANYNVNDIVDYEFKSYICTSNITNNTILSSVGIISAGDYFSVGDIFTITSGTFTTPAVIEIEETYDVVVNNRTYTGLIRKVKVKNVGNYTVIPEIYYTISRPSRPGTNDAVFSLSFTSLSSPPSPPSSPNNANWIIKPTINKGAWNSTTYYNVNDVVDYNDYSYICTSIPRDTTNTGGRQLLSVSIVDGGSNFVTDFNNRKPYSIPVETDDRQALIEIDSINADTGAITSFRIIDPGNYSVIPQGNTPIFNSVYSPFISNGASHATINGSFTDLPPPLPPSPPPPVDNANWSFYRKIPDIINKGAWAIGKYYNVNDMVISNDSYYICTTNHNTFGTEEIDPLKWIRKKIYGIYLLKKFSYITDTTGKKIQKQETSILVSYQTGMIGDDPTYKTRIMTKDDAAALYEDTINLPSASSNATPTEKDIILSIYKELDRLTLERLFSKYT